MKPCRILLGCMLASLCLLSGVAWAQVVTEFAYISNFNSNTVSVIDTASNTVVASVPVGINPYGVAVNPARTFAYVTNTGSNNTWVINTATNTVVATVPVGSSPSGVAVNPAGTLAYVANSASSTVSVIDTASNAVVATVPVGTGPQGVAVDPAGTFAYVTNYAGNTVSVIDAANNTVVATVPVGTNPYGVVVNPAGTFAYVTNANSNTLSVINTATNAVVATVPVGVGPIGVAVNPSGTFAYVANSVNSTVSVIDAATNTVVATPPVGGTPTGAAINSAGTFLYVANYTSNTVSVIDIATNAVIATVPVETGPVAFGNFIGGSPATVPGAPTGATATAGNAQAMVTFTAPASNGGSAITGYTVTSNPAGGFDSNADTTATSHIITGLTNGTAYTFTVTAKNAIGMSAPSAASNSVTPATVPGAPTGATAAAGNAQATVTFTAPASNGGSAITGYTVISNPGGGIDSNAGTTGTSHVVTGLTNGTAYTFTVTATNSVGTGAPSAPSASVTIGLAPTITMLSSSANPSLAGASVTFTATVAGTAPTGTVGFTNDGSTITGCGARVLPAGAANSKIATCSTSSMSVGQHSIVATYSGDAANNGSISATLSQVVNAGSSTTALSSSVNPSTVGTGVTFTASVTGIGPTGTLIFTDGGSTISGCSAVALTGAGNVRTAACSTSSLAVGSHSIVANYSGDGANTASNSVPLTQVVNAIVTIWVEDAVPSGATVGSDGGDGWNWISSNPTPYSGALAHQSADGAQHQHYFYGATTTLAVGVGDTLFTYVYLDPANPPIEVMLQWSDGSWAHRAYWGANIIGAAGTVTQTYMGGLPPTGQWVRLAVPAAQVGLEGRTLDGMAFTLYGGRATWDYAGKDTTVQPVTLASSVNPAAIGSSVTLTATVTGTNPSGSVNFTDSGSSISGCSAVALTGAGNVRTAACSTSTLAAGSHSIVANYSGDGANAASSSVSLTQVVNANVTIWVEDAVPSGATVGSDGGDGWNWVSSNPPPYSGALAHQSTGSSQHQHYFYGATATLAVGVGDTLFTYVYLDPANPPSEVMLQWSDGSWEHRAYWGANIIGGAGNVTQTYMGGLPPTGQWIRLAVPAAQLGLEGKTLNGMAFTLYGGRATWDYAGKETAAVVWVEDAVPSGATVGSDGGDGWNWISSNPTPFSGSLAHQSTGSLQHQHYFYGAATTLAVGVGDTLFTYVYLDPANPPSEVMLQWSDGSWAHRAYWGANIIGAAGTVTQTYMGGLPPAGQWIRLAVPAAQVGLEGSILDGMAFTLYGGRATWDYAGK